MTQIPPPTHDQDPGSLPTGVVRLRLFGAAVAISAGVAALVIVILLLRTVLT